MSVAGFFSKIFENECLLRGILPSFALDVNPRLFVLESLFEVEFELNSDRKVKVMSTDLLPESELPCFLKFTFFFKRW
jgi:hypothetical protein